jgi:hypothetical protein
MDADLTDPDATEPAILMLAASSISGAVDGDVSPNNTLQVDLPNVHVVVWAGKPLMVVGDAWTSDPAGLYKVMGLTGGASYLVQFDPKPKWDGLWYGEFWNNEPTVATADWVEIAHGGIDVAGIYALLQPVPVALGIHPESAANDGPNRYATEITIPMWGADWVVLVGLYQQAAPNRIILAYDWWIEDGVMHALFNLASPLAPTGMYELGWAWYDPWGAPKVGAWPNMFWILSSYVPTPPPTPTPTPTAAPVPVTPAPVVPAPVVTPTPAPQPVAGDITTTAYAASVKKGKIATLKYRVDEAVLGGTAAVTIQVKNAAGAVVKTVKVAAAPMNQDNSIQFKCNFKKGTYRYTVSVANAKNVASAALKVK